jgi:DMSO/TMAO reductase YedYZ molybdopterin-dependent catalytic subunit
MRATIRARLFSIAAVALLGAVTAVLAAQPTSISPPPGSAVALRVYGEVPTPLVLTWNDWAALPHQEFRAGFRDQSGVYRGVPISELLRRAGVPTGPGIRGPALRLYVVVRAADGYAAVFALAELDAGFTDRVVLVANARDGQPLGSKEGPLLLVVPGEKRGARWVRQVTELQVLSAP